MAYRGVAVGSASAPVVSRYAVTSCPLQRGGVDTGGGRGYGGEGGTEDIVEDVVVDRLEEV